MPARRRPHWRSYNPAAALAASSPPPPVGGKDGTEGNDMAFECNKKFKPGRIGLLAPVRSISDIVEAFACARMINQLTSQNLLHRTHHDVLRPTSVLVYYTLPDGAPAYGIVFRNGTNVFPVDDVVPYSGHTVDGSYLTFGVIEADPHYRRRFSCDPTGEASLADIQANAVASASIMLNDQIDGRSIAFQDAVDSRFRHMRKTWAASPPSPPPKASKLELSKHMPRPPPGDTEPFKPFVKPQSLRLNDLLNAFSTVVVEETRGRVLPLHPMCEHPSDPRRYPLLWAHGCGLRAS